MSLTHALHGHVNILVTPHEIELWIFTPKINNALGIFDEKKCKCPSKCLLKSDKSIVNMAFYHVSFSFFNIVSMLFV